MTKSKSKKLFAVKAWDPINAEYADLSLPEWVTYEKLPLRFWDDENNHKRYLKWITKELEIKKLDDWYSVSCKDFSSRRGTRLLASYGASHIEFITRRVKRKQWHIWKFKYVPRSFWEDPINRIAYLKWYGEEMGYKEPEDWYQLSALGLRERFGKVVSERGTFSEILSELYPNYQWLPWKFNTAERRFWSSHQNRVQYMQWLGKELGYKEMADWYSLSKRDCHRNYGRTMIDSFYHCTPYLAVADCFPEYDWKPWLFSGGTPSGFWSKKANRLEYLRWLGEEVGFKNQNDWYRLTDPILRSNHGTSVLEQCYKGSPHAAVRELFPKRAWHPWLFEQIPKGFWKKKGNRTSYYIWLGRKLEFKTKQDWQKLTKGDVVGNRASSMLKVLSFEQIRKEAISMKRKTVGSTQAQ